MGDRKNVRPLFEVEDGQRIEMADLWRSLKRSLAEPENVDASIIEAAARFVNALELVGDQLDKELLENSSAIAWRIYERFIPHHSKYQKKYHAQGNPQTLYLLIDYVVKMTLLNTCSSTNLTELVNDRSLAVKEFYWRVQDWYVQNKIPEKERLGDYGRSQLAAYFAHVIGCKGDKVDPANSIAEMYDKVKSITADLPLQRPS